MYNYHKIRRERLEYYNMNLLLDAHTHTLVSGHAYSTINEMIEAARQKGLKLLAITEHGPNMPGVLVNPFYFHNMRVIPREIDGLDLLMGAEANIIDYDGTIDLTEDMTRGLDIIIASLHLPCYKTGTVEENTRACVGAMKNPSVSVIGHPDDSRIPVDYEILVPAAKKHHVLLELNNSSLSPVSFRQNSRENAVKMLDLCKKFEVSILINSDAHIACDVGNAVYALELLKELNFPEHLVANTSLDLFYDFINCKK